MLSDSQSGMYHRYRTHGHPVKHAQPWTSLHLYSILASSHWSNFLTVAWVSSKKRTSTRMESSRLQSWQGSSMTTRQAKDGTTSTKHCVA